MGLFLPSFFQTRPKRTFDYKPRFYNEEKERIEALKQKYAAEASAEEADGLSAAGSASGDADTARAGAYAAIDREARMRQEFERQRPVRKTKGLLSRRAFLVAVALVVILLFVVS